RAPRAAHRGAGVDLQLPRLSGRAGGPVRGSGRARGRARGRDRGRADAALRRGASGSRRSHHRRQDRGGAATGSRPFAGLTGFVDMVLKVKEPIAEEYERMREGQILFTYLHLAAERELTQALLDHKVQGVAYETVQLEDGRLPLLAPMSEVAGRMAPHVGAMLQEKEHGGRGV